MFIITHINNLSKYIDINLIMYDILKYITKDVLNNFFK